MSMRKGCQANTGSRPHLRVQGYASMVVCRLDSEDLDDSMRQQRDMEQVLHLLFVRPKMLTQLGTRNLFRSLLMGSLFNIHV